MALPDYQSIMLPLLRFAGDGKEHSIREAIEFLAKQFKLTENERNELLPSGQQRVFDNRVGWARTYLIKSGILVSNKRAHFQISERGKNVLKENLKELSVNYLQQYPEFIEFKNKHNTAKEMQDNINDSRMSQTPEELLEGVYQKIREDLAQEILDKISECSPEFFERLVIDLLLKMGYGGSRRDAGSAIGKTGDEGIDGIIKEDKLGLDIIYIQAKRWKGTVGRPEIQKFVGALAGQKAKKGIFITTSSFTNDAVKYASSVESKVVLLDGVQLAQFMIDLDIGVSKVVSYEVKRIDSDYFVDE